MAVAIPIAAAAVTAGATIYSANQSSDAVSGASDAQTQSNAAALALNKQQADRTDAEYAPWRTVGAGALQMLARTEGIQVPSNTFSYYNLPTANDGTSATPGNTGTPGAAGPQIVTPGSSAAQAYLNAHPDVLAEYNQEATRDSKSKANLASLGINNAEDYAAWHYKTFIQPGAAANDPHWAWPAATAPVYAATGTSPPPPTPTPTGPQATDINGHPIVNTPGKPTGVAATPTGAPAGSNPRYGDFYASPDYQFRLDEGSRAITGNAAAKGLLDAGSTGQGLIKFGQNTASGEFGNWYNRIAALAGVGQTAVAGSAAAGAASTAAQTGILQQQGQNLASSIATQGGINAGLINGLGNTASGLIRNYTPGSTPGAAAAPPLPPGWDISAGSSGGLFGPPI